ncbi:hypothetical protein RGQ15_05835 [Paracoccus sp. MBLB3053]|uniref:Uncharacterized protein n=1 Tax=Paracoccus aurantius TaxID=3073814 RepID=A0ABU2HPW8_9RHOB|nr:hypothetical protein [Paracoccus sp. MBLB3053]MDS9467095.1 hypothetical protein [Paracoccus sp. MBLB3053]
MSALGSLRRIAAEQSRDRLLTWGIVASVIWLALVAAFAWLSPDDQAGDPVGWAIWLISVVLPLALIWFGVWSARSLSLLREEAEELRATLREMRVGSQPNPPTQPLDPAEPVARPDAPRAAPRRRVAVAPSPPAASDADQPPLDLGTRPAPELTASELFLALNFPDGPDDREAIRCLHLALADPGLARLIRAAQDVVTLLAGQGVYMDDLQIPETDPVLWRAFAEGRRGADIAGLAVIEDELALHAAAQMLRQDEVFRDVAHHFMRHFDRLLSRRSEIDDPAVLSALAETRSGRAFLLMAQVSGVLGHSPPDQP